MTPSVKLEGVQARRSDDGAHENHIHERHIYVVKEENAHTKWVVRIVSAGIVAALGFFVLLDRSNIDTKASVALQSSTVNASAISVLTVKLDNIQRTLEEIKVEVKEERKRGGNGGT